MSNTEGQDRRVGGPGTELGWSQLDGPLYRQSKEPGARTQPNLLPVPRTPPSPPEPGQPGVANAEVNGLGPTWQRDLAPTNPPGFHRAVAPSHQGPRCRHPAPGLLCLLHMGSPANQVPGTRMHCPDPRRLCGGAQRPCITVSNLLQVNLPHLIYHG